MRRLLVTAGLALVTWVGAAAALEARSTAGFDFGDAPDGREAYAGVQGSFPTRVASGGPKLGAAGPRIGRAWTVDDGASLAARSCATSTLTVILDVSRVPAGAPVYVNAWLDWNKDGDWADGRESAACGPEWGVQNYRVDPSKLAEKVVTLSLGFRAGRVPNEFWWRVQAHTGAPAPHAGGQTAPTSGGETEDVLHTSLIPPATGEPRALCFPGYKTIEHGSATSFRGVIVGAGSLRVTGVDVALAEVADAVVVFRKKILPPQSVRVDVASTNRHRPPANWGPVGDVIVRITIHATHNARPISRTRGCRLYVSHAPKVAARPVAGVGSDATGGRRGGGCSVTGAFVVKGAPRHGIANYGIDVTFPRGARIGAATLTVDSTGKRPAPNWIDPLLKWSEHRSRLTPDGLMSFFVQVAYRDSNDPAEPRIPFLLLWRYTVAYEPPPGSKACDAVLAD